MQKFTYKKWKIMSAASREQAEELFDYIDKKEYDVAEWLKKHPRSEVIKFQYDGTDLILKIPKEKNSRPWIRFTTLYRQGEAFKNISSMELLRSIGINTTKPVMAAEKRTFGMVTDSWIVYEYLQGENCLGKKNLYPEVVKLLKKIHDQGYLHNDPQIRNFMANEKGIFVIDSNPTKPTLGALSKAFEFNYLAKSAPGIVKYFGSIKNSLLYKTTGRIDKIDRKWAGYRKRIKKSLKLC